MIFNDSLSRLQMISIMIITLIYRYNQPKKFTGLPVHNQQLRMKVQ